MRDVWCCLYVPSADAPPFAACLQQTLKWPQLFELEGLLTECAKSRSASLLSAFMGQQFVQTQACWRYLTSCAYCRSAACRSGAQKSSPIKSCRSCRHLRMLDCIYHKRAWHPVQVSMQFSNHLHVQHPKPKRSQHHAVSALSADSLCRKSCINDW